MTSASRETFVQRSRIMRAEIQQLFDDAARWNSTHAEDEPIDPDPDGQLRKIADGLDKFIAAEALKPAGE